MNKHTEGPWLILPEEPNIPYIRIRGSQLGRRYKIANVHADRESDLPETRANAQLIAAAPCLLETLIKIRDRLDAGDYDEWALQSLYRLAKDAIKTANGPVTQSNTRR